MRVGVLETEVEQSKKDGVLARCREPSLGLFVVGRAHWRASASQSIIAPEMPDDTQNGAREAQVAALRRLGPSGRLRLAAEMSEDARQISIEGERRRHPELTEAEARLAVLRRMWGSELAARVAGAGIATSRR